MPNHQLILSVIDECEVLSVPANDVKDRSLEELGIDSLDLINMSMIFEDKLKLKINIDVLTNKATLSDLIGALENL